MTAPVQLRAQVGPKRAEMLFADPLGGDRYRLRSIPFLATGLALGDIVEARDGHLVGVLEPGGHRTVRLRLNWHPTPEEFAPLWAPLAALGCVCESSSAGLLAVDVPPGIPDSALASDDWTLQTA